jgi:large subunit ribosomal protein L10
MALTKDQKEKIIKDLEEKIEKQKAIAFFDIAGLKVKKLSQLRKTLKEKDCELKVTKKTLLQIALKEKRINIEAKKLEGEVALGFGYKDEILPFRIASDFLYEPEGLKIIGGIIENKVVDKEKALFLASLQSKEELLARLVRSISAPIYNFVNVLQAPLEACIFAIRAIGEIKTNK